MKTRARTRVRFVTTYLGVFATLLAWWYVLGLVSLTDRPLATVVLAYAVPVLAWVGIQRVTTGTRR